MADCPASEEAMQTLETKIPPLVVAIAIGCTMKLCAYAWPLPIDSSPLLAVLGIGLCQLSAAIALLAFVTFAHARTTINPLDPSRASSLVTWGIFRISRNPMYLSLLLLLIAYALRLASWLECVGPALFVAYVTRFQIIPEEEILAQKFGAAFHAYRIRTRRWL